MSRESWTGSFQRARVVRARDHQELVGRELWVRVGRPQDETTRDIYRIAPDTTSPCYQTNLFDDFGDVVLVGAHHLELLARNERDFAERVDCVYWKDFRDGRA